MTLPIHTVTPTREELLALVKGAAWLLDSPLVPDCVKDGPTGRRIRQVAAEIAHA